MIKEGIEYILSLAQSDRETPPTFVPTMALRDDVKVVSLEKYDDTPAFHRAGFGTSRLTDFIDYLSGDTQGQHTAVFIDEDASGAHAIIDMGTHAQPGWGHHIARLVMRRTPEYAAIQDISGESLTQRQLIEFLEDFHYCITPIIKQSGQDEGAPGSVAHAIQIVRKIEISASKDQTHEENDYEHVAEGMESIEMRGRQGNKIEELQIHCSPFEDTGQRTITVRVSMSTESGTPKLKLRIKSPEVITRNIQSEIESNIHSAEELNGARVFVGQIKHQ